MRGQKREYRMSAKTAGQRGQTLLLIDDSASALAALVQALQAQGMTVAVAHDLQQAMRHAHRTPPDLVLLAARAAGHDGAAACAQLKQQPALHEVPFIVVTADAGSRQRAFACGAADCIAQPLQVADTVARIELHLRLRIAQRCLAQNEAALRRENALRRESEQQLHRMHALLEQRSALPADELVQLNASLRQSESRLRRLVESNIIGIFFWNGTRRIIDANDAFLQLLGYTRADLEDGKIGWERMSPPEYAASVERVVAEMRRTGSFTPYEKEYIRKDGSRVPVLVGGALLDAAHEEGVAFVLDLSAHKRAEEQIRDVAPHDALTGLPNRRMGENRLQPAIPHAARTGTAQNLTRIEAICAREIGCLYATMASVSSAAEDSRAVWPSSTNRST